MNSLNIISGQPSQPSVVSMGLTFLWKPGLFNIWRRLSFVNAVEYILQGVSFVPYPANNTF